jgi:hypothetical protein
MAGARDGEKSPPPLNAALGFQELDVGGSERWQSPPNKYKQLKTFNMLLYMIRGIR